jgi:ubiquinone/menaquinone biosynthesis C-methylase UbiE
VEGYVESPKVKSEEVERYLTTPTIHRQWERAYRTAENETFFNEAFDYIERVVNAPKGAAFVDVGCGVCSHSIRLAKRGFLVHAMDCSESVLVVARTNVNASSLSSRIKILAGNVLALPFEDGSLDYVLCWGVLMHVAEIDKAVSELSRVLRDGGRCVVSESNMRSLQAVILRHARRLLRREKADVRRLAPGVEHWVRSPEGTLVTRETDMAWLIGRFKENGLILKRRVAGQFTEAYTRASSPLLVKLIHRINGIYFHHVRLPHFSFGNILILEKAHGNP